MVRKSGPDRRPALTVHFVSRRLRGLFENAPPGQTGWMIPLDPALAPLRAHRSFEPVLALLSARAM